MLKSVISQKLKAMSAPGAVALGLGLGVSESAMAIQVNQVAQNIENQFQSVADLLSGGAYLGGAGFGIKSALKFKEYNESQNGQVKLSQPITLGLVSGALLALPSFLTVGSDSAGLEKKNALNQSVLGGTLQ